MQRSGPRGRDSRQLAQDRSRPAQGLPAQGLPAQGWVPQFQQIEELKAAQAGRPAPVPGPGPVGRAGKFLVRRLLPAVAVLALVLVLGFAVLLVATPSVGNARDLARRMDDSHGAVYPGDAVPARFATALEATEDHRFTSEPGVDPVAVLRVGWAAVRGKTNQGGATLYQQLAKMLYTPGRASLSAKAEQVALAVKLKYRYSGQEILQMYADIAYFGHGFYGLDQASCGYFGVRPAQLSWPQAAMLAGLVQGPSSDDPISYPAAGRAREGHVIGRLVAVGAISQAQADGYLQMPLSTLLAGAGACRA